VGFNFISGVGLFLSRECCAGLFLSRECCAGLFSSRECCAGLFSSRDIILADFPADYRGGKIKSYGLFAAAKLNHADYRGGKILWGLLLPTKLS
jgi:hypothetical protein